MGKEQYLPGQSPHERANAIRRNLTAVQAQQRSVVTTTGGKVNHAATTPSQVSTPAAPAVAGISLSGNPATDVTGTSTSSSGSAAQAARADHTHALGIVPASKGGTNTDTSATAAGSLPYFSAIGTWAFLAKNTTSHRYLQGGATPTWAQVDLSDGVTGALPVLNGGTGQTTYTNGQLLIGNTSGNTLTKATLTAGSNVTITNAGGSITIAAASISGGDTAYEIWGAGANYTLTVSYAAVTFASALSVTLPTAGQAYLVTAYLDVLEQTAASDDIRAFFYDSTAGAMIAQSERRVSYNPATGRGLIVMERIITAAANNTVIQIYATNATAARGIITSFRTRMFYKTVGTATSALMSNSFTPSSVSGLVSWYDANNISSPPATGGNLSTWNDLGSAALNLSAGATPPTYQTNVINGLPVVRFTASTNGMTTASLPTNSLSFTMFLVCSIVAASGLAAIYQNGQVSGGLQGYGIMFGDNNAVSTPFCTEAQYRSIGSFGGTPSLTPQNGWLLIELSRLAGTGTFKVNNVSKGTSGLTPNTPTTNLTLGTTKAVDIAEALMWNVGLGATDEGNVVAYLASKWGVLI